MSLSPTAGSSRLLRVVPAGLLGVAAMAACVLSSATAASASTHRSDPCTGSNSSVGSDYTFTGAGQAGVTYVVRITMPNGNSFAPTVTADATSNWSETWYANMAGLYKADVSLYKTGQAVTSCSLTVS